MFFICGVKDEQLGVRLEVLQDLSAKASQYVEAQLVEVGASRARAAEPSPRKGGGMIGFRRSTKQSQEPERTYESMVTLEIIATRVVRPRMQETKRPFTASLYKDPALLKEKDKLVMPANVGQVVGRANVLLVIADNLKAEKALESLTAIKEIPHPAYFYLDELCSVDIKAPVAHAAETFKAPPAGEAPTPTAGSRSSAAPKRTGSFSGQARKNSVANDLMSPGTRSEAGGPSAASGAGASVQQRSLASQKRREARLLANRRDYWGRTFPDVVRSLSKAVFVVDNLSDITFCEGTRDMSWLYSLHVAQRELGPARILFQMPSSERKELERMLLDSTERTNLFKAIRAVSFETSTARTESEAEALSAAILPELEQATAAISSLLTRWMLEQSDALVKARLALIDKADKRQQRRELEGEIADVFELMRASLDLRVHYWQEQAEEPAHAKGDEAGKGSGAVAAWLEDACERAVKVYEFAQLHFGKGDEKTVEGSHQLANMYRRRRDAASMQKAIDIYKDIILFEDKLEASMQNKMGDMAETLTVGLYTSSGAMREQRLAGTHMQLANTLRDLGRHSEAHPHYRAALKYSLEGTAEGLGAESLNTQYCRMSLANCLRVLRDECANAEAVEKARRAKANAVSAADKAAAVEALTKAEESYDKAVAMLKEAEKLYREAHSLIARHFKTLDNVTISAKLNHACILLEMALAPEDKWEKEARAHLEELLMQCTDVYGPNHECTIYVSAKLGELKMRFDRDPRERNSGRQRVQDALKAFERLKLPLDHPRVEEVRKAKARAIQTSNALMRTPSKAFNSDRDSAPGAGFKRAPTRPA